MKDFREPEMKTTQAPGGDKKLKHEELQTLIPIVVSFETPSTPPDKTSNSNIAVKGFRGIVRTVSRSNLIIEAEVDAKKVTERAQKQLFAILAPRQTEDYLFLLVKVAWVRDIKTVRIERRCLVGLDIISANNETERLEAFLSDIRAGKVLCKEFIMDRTVYFGDTNVEGNVYFAKFFEWQGAVREEFYLQTIPGALELLNSGTRIVTAEAKVQFRSQFVLFDKVTIEVKVKEVKTSNLELLFLYRKKSTGELAAIGSQRLAFTNTKGQIIPVPSRVADSLQPYIDPYIDWKTYL